MEKKENKWEDEKVTLTEVLIEKSLEEKLLLLLLDSGPLQRVLDWLKLEACPACYRSCSPLRSVWTLRHPQKQSAVVKTGHC